jgi:LCP family protein required for cell wall assembly
MPQPAAVRDRGPSAPPSGPDRCAALDPAARLRRAVALLVLTLVLPGSAQVLAGNRVVGRIVRRVWLGLVGCLLLVGLAWLIARPVALWLITSPTVLNVAAVASACWAAVMLAVLVDAWRLGRPDLLPIRVRRWLAAAAALLVLATGYPCLALGARASAAADLIGNVFSGTRTSAAVAGRFNILLLGGDAGPDRIGTRPDSVTLASIEVDTGRTVLFSLPRNLENVPFAPGSPGAQAWPHGYSCGDGCLLNAIYTWASEHPDLFPGAADPGAEAMREAVQGVTGLTVNYYVLIDLAGFEQLINAMGGITVNVQAPVPIGGGSSKVSGYVQPGTQHLDGYHALWFARSRHGASDYDRMARQRCVMDAMLRQLDPQAVLANFQQIAAASRNVVSTDIPVGQLPTFLGLAVKARGQPVRSIQFVPPLITPARPDFGVVQSRVAQAIAASRDGSAGAAAVAQPPAGAKASATTSAAVPAKKAGTGQSRTPTGRPSSAASPTPTVPTGGDDVGSVCSPG